METQKETDTEKNYELWTGSLLWDQVFPVIKTGFLCEKVDTGNTCFYYRDRVCSVPRYHLKDLCLNLLFWLPSSLSRIWLLSRPIENCISKPTFRLLLTIFKDFLYIHKVYPYWSTQNIQHIFHRLSIQARCLNPNVSTTPVTAMGRWQCLPFS